MYREMIFKEAEDKEISYAKDYARKGALLAAGSNAAYQAYRAKKGKQSGYRILSGAGNAAAGSGIGYLIGRSKDKKIKKAKEDEELMRMLEESRAKDNAGDTVNKTAMYKKALFKDRVYENAKRDIDAGKEIDFKKIRKNDMIQNTLATGAGAGAGDLLAGFDPKRLAVVTAMGSGFGALYGHVKNKTREKKIRDYMAGKNTFENQQNEG